MIFTPIKFEDYIKLNWNKDIPNDCTKLVNREDCTERNNPEPCKSCQEYCKLIDKFYTQNKKGK